MYSLYIYNKMDSKHYMFIYSCYYGRIKKARSLITTVSKHKPEDLMPMISSLDYYSLRWACNNGHFGMLPARRMTKL